MSKLLSTFIIVLCVQLLAAQYCGNSGTSQCIPSGTLTQPGFSPATQNLPPLVNGTTSNVVLQFKNYGTITFGGQTMSVNSLRFDTIGNLPSNLCWTCNKSNNTYAKLEDGCIKISGTVCSTPGQYKLKFVATMDIGVPIVTDLDLLGLKYYLRIKNNGDADVLVDTGQTTPFVAYGPATNCVLCPCTLSQSSYTCPNSNANNYGNIVNVTAASGCIWATSVTSGGSWLSTTSSGNGNGSISISVLANNTGAARTGTIDVNGQTLTITQTSCFYVIPTSYTCPNSSANSYGIGPVVAPIGCAWAASVTSGGSWLSSTSSGNGNGSISITVLANTSASSRTGTIDVAGQTLTITQPGVNPCTPSLSQSSYVCSDNSANTYNNIVNVATASGCAWAAGVFSGNSWLSTNSSGNGNGSISITVQANTTNFPRTGDITTTQGGWLTVTQPGCDFQLSQNSYSCPSGAAGTYSSIVIVTAPGGCTWAATVTSGSSWLSTTSTDNGTGTISISVLANNSATTLTGNIDVNGETLTIIQPPLSSAINEVTQGDFIITPNPVIDKLYLDYTSNQTFTGCQIRLVNNLGQQVLTRQLVNATTVIDVSTCPKGVYVVQLLNGQNAVVGAKQIVLR